MGLELSVFDITSAYLASALLPTGSHEMKSIEKDTMKVRYFLIIPSKVSDPVHPSNIV